MAYTVPPLSYDYGALEPHIDARTMTLHHDKHHQSYVDKLNDAVRGTEFDGKPIEEVIRHLDQVPEDKRTVVRNNGGGHLNHGLFWESMSPNGGAPPDGALASAIDDAFGSFDEFKEKFEAAGVGQFGSGWAWLVLDGGSLAIMSTPNQDNPVSNGQTPLVGNDVWEHAYYLKYQNKRPEYLKAWWNVVNWGKVAERFEAAHRKTHARGVTPVREQSQEVDMTMGGGQTTDQWLTTLRTDTAQEGFELAIKLARNAVKATQPDGDLRAALREAYNHDTAQLIAASDVVASYFQTVAAANDYWRASAGGDAAG
jgi:superoxide dismutase, Fe-Mn family